MSGRRPVERVRGTLDVWRDEANRLESISRTLAATVEIFGYRRVEVPVIEHLELHLRKSGGDILSKLYAFTDQGGRRLCLRPELTASIVRAYVAESALRLPLKLYACGPVFRYEKPQKGRYRQFTELGVELIGTDEPVADAEVIYLARRGLADVGVHDTRVVIGHVGILADHLRQLGLSARLAAFLLEHLELARRHGIAAVRDRLAEHDPALGGPAADESPAPAARPPVAAYDEALLRAAAGGLPAQVGSNPTGQRTPEEILERLVHKLHRRDDRARIQRALTFIERLCDVHGPPRRTLAAGRRLLAEHGLDPRPLDELESILELLEVFGSPAKGVELDLALSRGLAYYTGMAFEVYHRSNGVESQLCGGGRYDDLVRALGGRHPTPALGFAYGLERICRALDGGGRLEAPEESVFVAAAGDEALPYAVRVLHALHETGIRAQLDVRRRGLRNSLAYAHREGFGQAVIVGKEEELQGTVKVRDLGAGSERVLALTDVAALRAQL